MGSSGHYDKGGITASPTADSEGWNPDTELATRPADTVLLLYHGVAGPGPDGHSRFSVSRDMFAAHLRLLRRLEKESAVQVLGLPAWWSGMAARARPVVSCFDDGGRSDYEHVLPLLSEFGFRASFFITPARVGRPGYMDWTQIRALAAAGMHIECHGWDHVPLTRLAPAALSTHLRVARHTLQQGAGAPVQFLAVPFGFWNRRVHDIAMESGYGALCTSHPGLARAGTLQLKRNALRASTSVRQLQAWLQGHRGTYARRIGRHWLLWTPKQILVRLHTPTATPIPARSLPSTPGPTRCLAPTYRARPLRRPRHRSVCLDSMLHPVLRCPRFTSRCARRGRCVK
ncbi:MAG: polysaccharide deacetylase family protein [Terriglobales bacterium]